MTLDRHTRFSFALDMLDEVEHAEEILADLLEESGETAVAQWSRTRKKDPQSKLDFVLEVLPYTTNLDFACSIVDRIEPTISATRWSVARRVFHSVRAWLRRVNDGHESEGREIDEAIAALNERAFFADEEQLGRCVNAFCEAAENAKLAWMCDNEGHRRDACEFASVSRRKVRRTARIARELERARELEFARRHSFPSVREVELSVQIGRVRRMLLEELNLSK